MEDLQITSKLAEEFLRKRVRKNPIIIIVKKKAAIIILRYSVENGIP